jgi:dolichyl-diphosphooligosaccharide--protein glycosyltransferase
MNGCLLHVLHSNGLKEGVEVDRNRFREVYTSKYRKVRIYKILSVSKESKEWVINNRKCDAPGSWFCPGQYPPALKTILEQKSDFAQLEDFNRGTKDDEYTKEYFENLNKKTHGSAGKPQDGVKASKQKFKKLAPEYVEKLNEKWEDNAVTTKLWDLISQNDLAGIRDFILENPAAVHVRSKDGRGPMWWAHEYGRKTMISMLQQLGVSETLEDKNGMTPLDVLQKTD